MAAAEQVAADAAVALADPTAGPESLSAVDSSLSTVDLEEAVWKKIRQMEALSEALPTSQQTMLADLRKRCDALSDQLARLRESTLQTSAALDDFNKKADEVRRQVDGIQAARATILGKGEKDLEERVADSSSVEVGI